MKIQTMSIVCGTESCDAHCPFCVSKMTPKINKTHGKPKVNWRNFSIACKLAEKAGATTCLITGKGEPTLYPTLIVDYLSRIAGKFPFIELQTNGIRIGNGQVPNHILEGWYKYGLTTICLSAVGTGDTNKNIYSKEYPNIADTVRRLHTVGFSIRLSIMMLKEYIDSPTHIKRVVEFCKKNEIEQLTVRPITYPENTDNEISRWVANHALNDNEILAIKHHIIDNATPVLHLSHGATVYDYDGQNLCLTNCLTTNDTDDNMRQIIFFPDGTISYDWKYEGARLL